MSGNKLTIQNRTWLKRLKEVDNSSMKQITDLILPGEELEVTVLNTLTRSICMLDHGPSLALIELKAFCRKITREIRELRNDFEELFCHFVTAMAQNEKDQFCLKNTNVMIFKPPYCVIVKFGYAETVKYLFQLENHAMYSMGDANMKPSFYFEGSYDFQSNLYDDLQNLLIEAQNMKALGNFAKFKAHVNEENYNVVKDYDDQNEKSKQYSQALSVMMESVTTNIASVRKEEEKLSKQMSSLKLLYASPEEKKRKNLYLPELDPRNRKPTVNLNLPELAGKTVETQPAKEPTPTEVDSHPLAEPDDKDDAEPTQQLYPTMPPTNPGYNADSSEPQELPTTMSESHFEAPHIE